MLDYNEERNEGKQLERKNKNRKEGLVRVTEKNEKYDAKIFIDTIEPFEGHGGGSYLMSSVKRVDATLDFLKLPENVKMCQNEETLSECSSRRFQKNGVIECLCKPFGLSHIFNKVRCILVFFKYFF